MPKKNTDTSGLKRFLVGGPLLGSRHQALLSDIVSWHKFEPLITPEIELNNRQSQRFILLPHSRYISVLAYKTGSQVAKLVPFLVGEDEKDKNATIESACLAKYPRKQSQTNAQDVLDQMDVDEKEVTAEQSGEEIVVMVGCQDGTIREFSLNCLETLNDKSPVNCGPYQVSGPCCRPRRVIRVSRKEPIMQLTAPVLRNHVQDDGLLAYVVARTKGLEKSTATEEIRKDKADSVNVSVMRVIIPHFDGSTDVTVDNKSGLQRKAPLDRIHCRVGKDKDGRMLNTAPFRMYSIAKSNNKDQGHSVFIVLARPNAITVYYEQLNSSHRFSPLSFSMPTNNPLTAISVSTNKSDITCGHFQGEIKVMNSILNQVEDYHLAMATNSKPDDPRNNYITSRVHWHAHPVTSLAYDAVSSPRDPILYSGGDESVLVTWQLSQGSDRPSDVLPRLALGGIVHVSCADRLDDNPCNGVLVYCEDNSLQLFESHNKGRSWKLQGLAWKSNNESCPDARIQVDPRARGAIDSRLVITGLPGAPGYMHWYDPIRQQMCASLEVAPFNRISRTDREDTSLPTPSVTNHVFSQDGRVLITLEETPTENSSIGAPEKVKKKVEYGIVSTIRFWSLQDSFSTQQGNKPDVPYSLSAAMTYPHGPKNRISALAMSNDGSLACTVSNEERAFRVWHKLVTDEDDVARRVPSWTCRYKVAVPSGFSNFVTKRDGVAISDDGSIVAICFGNMVTLWDIEEARFLTSMRHLESSKGSIDSVKFVSPGKLQDLLLISSGAGVSLQSPFASQKVFAGWSWDIPTGVRGVKVSSANIVDSHGCVTVTVFNSLTSQTRLIFIDATSGKPGVETSGSGSTKVVSGIEGCISSMCSVGKAEIQSNWGGRQTSSRSPLHLYALNSSGELHLFTTGNDDAVLSAPEWKDISQPTGPKLDIGRSDDRKRQRKGTEIMDIPGAETGTKKMAVEIFGLTTGEESMVAPSTTTELPFLSRNFVRAFVGRSLSRRTKPQAAEED